MKKIIFMLTIILMSVSINGQEKPAFYDDIQNFKKIDQQNPPPQNAILFIGSSSFTMWKDVNNYFPTKNIINRGFGGSSLLDLNYYSDDLLKPYNPKQIVIYCGENDFAANHQLKPKIALKRFKDFYSKLRKYYPEIEVDYISIKRSPSREELWKQMAETNKLINKFLKTQKNTHYIDITKIMQDSDGNVRQDLFLDDHLHMKPQGYQLWTKIIEPYLK